MTARVVKQEFDPAIPISKLKEHPDNPRRGRDDVVDDSIEANGFYGAVIVHRKTRHVLAGNTRFRVMRAKGAETIPGFWVTCDEITARRIMLADNRTSDLAEYDDETLANVLDDIGDDLFGTGYTDAEFQAMIDALLDKQDRELPIPELNPAGSVVQFKFGDIAGQIDVDIYDDWVARYEQARSNVGEHAMLEDVIGEWLRSL